MSNVMDSLELVLVDAHKVKGWQWVHEEPLWVTWSLEAFGMIPNLFPLQLLSSSPTSHPCARNPKALPSIVSPTLRIS